MRHTGYKRGREDTEPISKKRKKSIIKVLMLGKTGSGKSHLANLLLQDERFETSCGIESCTERVQVEENQNYRILDTVGFEDSGLGENEVLHRLLRIKHTCRNDGVHVFMYLLSGRMTPTEERGFNIFVKQLFGIEALKRLIVVRTHFEEYDDPEKVQRMKNEIQKLFHDKFGFKIPSHHIVALDNRKKELESRKFAFQNLTSAIFLRDEKKPICVDKAISVENEEMCRKIINEQEIREKEWIDMKKKLVDLQKDKNSNSSQHHREIQKLKIKMESEERKIEMLKRQLEDQNKSPGLADILGTGALVLLRVLSGI